MVVLITGGSGFIGRNLRDALQHSHTVLAPSRQELDLLDVAAVRSYLERHTIDVVIHAATTPSHRNAPPVADVAVRNIRMFFGLVRNQNLFGKLIFLSSGAVYDHRYYLPRMREEYFETHVPVDEHGFSKYVCAKYIEQAPNMLELRLFGVFGKHEDYEIRFISNAICKALYDLPITIRQNRRFDYLYVEDLPTILEWCLTASTRDRTFNVTTDETVELKALAEMVRDISGKKVDIRIAKEGLGVEYSGDNSRLRLALPGLRFTPFQESVPRLYEWYREHKDSIPRERLLVDK